MKDDEQDRIEKLSKSNEEELSERKQEMESAIKDMNEKKIAYNNFIKKMKEEIDLYDLITKYQEEKETFFQKLKRWFCCRKKQFDLS